MSMRSKLTIAAVATGAAVAALGALPVAASAEPCTVTVTVAGGQALSFNVNLPAGATVNPRTLTSLPVLSVTQTCTSASGTSTTTTSSKSSSSTSSSSSSSSSTRTSTAGHPSKPTVSTQPPTRVPGKPKAKKPTSPGKGKTGGKTGPGTTGNTKVKPPATTTAGGAPSAGNPTFSFALPGPAPVGVPNFFIDSFRIPPFLLPIYQAAGIQYDVPWQVLAGINEIETDYGRNLSVSSAGAVGWMQFMPATWKTWGVDANGDGVRDPYNPVDAIFAAARYLSAAGASKNISQAIFAYNHAGWYVQSVLLRAKLIGGVPAGLDRRAHRPRPGPFPGRREGPLRR